MRIKAGEECFGIAEQRINVLARRADDRDGLIALTGLGDFLCRGNRNIHRSRKIIAVRERRHHASRGIIVVNPDDIKHLHAVVETDLQLFAHRLFNGAIQLFRQIIRNHSRAFRIRIVFLVDKPPGDHVQIFDSQGVRINTGYANAAGHPGLTDRAAANVL